MKERFLRASLLFALFVPLLASNCSSGGMQSAADKPVYAQQSAPSVDGGQPNSTAALASAEVPASASDYRLSPRDIVDISVFQVADLNKTVQVGEDGNVSLPLIGRTHIGGKTTQEAEQEIAAKLRKKYLQSPQVSVSIKQYGQRVTVSGAVTAPKVLAVEGALTLSQAIATAGGLTDLAEPTRVHIARSVDGRIRDEVYNYEAIQAGKLKDPTLQGGDLVVAEQSGARVAFKNVKDMLPFAVLASVL